MQLSREAFDKLSAEEIQDLTGVDAPANDLEEEDFLERAWKAYKQDVTNEEEWGGNEGESLADPEANPRADPEEAR